MRKAKDSLERAVTAAKQAMDAETDRWQPKEKPRWPQRGDRILLVKPHRWAGETATVIGFDKPSDFPGDPTVPRVRLEDGRETLVEEPQWWKPA